MIRNVTGDGRVCI